MDRDQKALETIDDYIASFSPHVQAVLQKVRSTVRRVAPAAVEKISYRMPAFALEGIIIYFAAFKNHIGVYPPVKGDAALMADLKPYAGEKGNLRFSLEEPIPYATIRRVAQRRLAENLRRAAAKRGKKRTKRPSQ